MTSSGSYRGRLATAGGILSIIDGALEVIGGGTMVGLVIAHREMFRLAPPGSHPGIFFGRFGALDLNWLLTVGVPIFALGIVAIIGGISAIRRESFRLSLAGAICTLPSVILGLYLGAGVGALTSVILGILAVVFVALGKREFGPEK